MWVERLKDAVVVVSGRCKTCCKTVVGEIMFQRCQDVNIGPRTKVNLDCLFMLNIYVKLFNACRT